MTEDDIKEASSDLRTRRMARALWHNVDGKFYNLEGSALEKLPLKRVDQVIGFSPLYGLYNLAPTCHKLYSRCWSQVLNEQGLDEAIKVRSYHKAYRSFENRAIQSVHPIEPGPDGVYFLQKGLRVDCGPLTIQKIIRGELSVEQAKDQLIRYFPRWFEIKNKFEQSDFYKNMIEDKFKDYDDEYCENVKRRELLCAYASLCQLMDWEPTPKLYPDNNGVIFPRDNSYKKIFPVLKKYLLDGSLTLEVFIKKVKIGKFPIDNWLSLTTEIGQQWVDNRCGSIEQLIDWQIMSLKKREEPGPRCGRLWRAESLAQLLEDWFVKKCFGNKKLRIDHLVRMIEEDRQDLFLTEVPCRVKLRFYIDDNDSLTVDDILNASPSALSYICDFDPQETINIKH